MKLNKIISCMFSITTIGVLTPICSSCNKSNLILEFGNSINCLSKDKDHTEKVKYNNYDSVFNAVKKHVNVEQPKSVNINNINTAKTFQNVYWDFLAGFLLNNYIFYLDNTLNDESTSFETFNFEYKAKDSEEGPTIIQTTSINSDSFMYENNNGKVYIQFKYNDPTINCPIQSYTYQNCTIN